MEENNDNKIILTTCPSMPPFEEYAAEINSIWKTKWLTNMGEKHKAFEKALKSYLQSEELTLFCNGHMALELILQAMQLEGEVITTPFTFASTTHAIVRNHLTPVFCDIHPDTFTMDIDKLENLITERTCAILPVHVYGNVCEIEKIEAIARQYKLKVIYDAAHAFGVTYRGKEIGSYGDASMFSFHATKVFNSIEGGAVCYHDESLRHRLNGLKNFGIRDMETVDAIGCNAKMNEFQAAMGLCNLRHLDEEIKKRKIITERYRQLLTSVTGIKLNVMQEKVESNYAYFPILVDEQAYGHTRDELYDMLLQQGIYARKYFYPLTNTFPCYQTIDPKISTPIALQISKQVLTLPLYAELEISVVDQICQLIYSFQASAYETETNN